MPLSVNNTSVRCQLKPMSCAQLISSTTMLYHDVHRCLPHSLCCICNVSQGHRHTTAWLGLANVLLEIEIPTESPARTHTRVRSGWKLKTHAHKRAQTRARKHSNNSRRTSATPLYHLMRRALCGSVQTRRTVPLVTSLWPVMESQCISWLAVGIGAISNRGQPETSPALR